MKINIPALQQEWHKKKSEFAFAHCAYTHSDFLVTRPGFEPRLTVPKTAVLPLHHQAIKAANIECDLKINKLLL